MKHKVLHIHASAILGGTELRAFQIASKLKSSFDIALLFHCPSGPICQHYLQESIPFEVIPYPSIFKAMRYIRRLNPDLIHIFGLKTNLLWRPILYATGFRNLIGHIAGLSNSSEEPGWIRIKADLWSHRFLKVYLANSEKVGTKLTTYGFSPQIIRVIRNGVQVPKTTSHAVHSPPTLISIGNLRAVKGQIDLLKVCALLKQRGVRFRLIIIGTGPDQHGLENWMRSYGLESFVEFRGQVDNLRLLNELSESDVFVLMSLSEGISGAAMEAMAAGLPVVATNVGGMAELIEFDQNGFLVPVHDVQAAANRLESILTDENLRMRLGQRARETILKKFNLDDTVRKYHQLYLDVFSPAQ